MKTITKKKCILCEREFEKPISRIDGRFCGSVCYYQYASGNRTERRVFMRRKALNKPTKQMNSKHFKVCADFKKSFLIEHGYLFCEVCKINTSIAFSTHHIYFASQYPKHPQLHNKKNLILLCQDCHTKFHENKYKPQLEQLEQERGLKKLFGIQKAEMWKSNLEKTE